MRNRAVQCWAAWGINESQRHNLSDQSFEQCALPWSPSSIQQVWMEWNISTDVMATTIKFYKIRLRNQFFITIGRKHWLCKLSRWKGRATQDRNRTETMSTRSHHSLPKFAYTSLASYSEWLPKHLFQASKAALVVTANDCKPAASSVIHHERSCKGDETEICILNRYNQSEKTNLCRNW